MIAGLPPSQQKPVLQPLGTWISRQLTASLLDRPQTIACHLNKIKPVYSDRQRHTGPQSICDCLPFASGIKCLVTNIFTAEARHPLSRDSWLDLPSLLVTSHHTFPVHFQENNSLREPRGEFRSSKLVSRETVYQNIWFLTYTQKN